VFVGQQADLGGAILTGSSVTQVTIQDSSFHSCYSRGHGGAIDHAGSALNITRCCAVNCSALTQGNFLRLTKSNSSHTISGFSMVSIGASSNSGIGGIYCASNIGLTMSFVNSSACTALNYGSVVYSTGGTLIYLLRYINAVNSMGYSAFDNNDVSAASSVTFCNLYANEASNGVISSYNYQADLVVDQCIFKDNSGNRDLYAIHNKIQASNCVFSATTIPSSYAINFGGNLLGTTTPSHQIFAVGAFVCFNVIPRTITRSPAGTARPTRSRSARPTVSPSARPTVSHSPVLTVSHSPQVTDSPLSTVSQSQSQTPPGSFSPFATDSPSPTGSSTLTFTICQPITIAWRGILRMALYSFVLV
jgi:hypothetical protein